MNYAPKHRDFYVDWADPPSMAKRIIAADQAKFNLSWLVFPELDTKGVSALCEDYALSMDYMDAVTRRHLMMLPMDFIAYWSKLDDGTMRLAEHMPNTRIQTMMERAMEAQKRLAGLRQDGNVVFVNKWINGRVTA